MGKKTVIYLRISDDREGRELGVQRQEEDTRALVARAGDELVAIYKDNDISASTRSTKHRPDYSRMLADGRTARYQKIVAYTTSRLTRRPREHEDQIELAEKYGIEFAYVASPSFDLNTAAGRRIARILAANDAGHSEDISELVRREKLQMAQAGRWRGGPRPFGYDEDGVGVRPDEALALAAAARAILAGESLRGQAVELNARGLRTTMGREWTGDKLRAALTRVRNIAKVGRYGEVVADAEWAPIMDEDLYFGVRALLRSRELVPGSRLGRVRIGAGVYLCGVCADGTTMCSARTGGRANRGRPGYRCRASGHLVRIAEPLDALVERAVVTRLARRDAVELVRDAVRVDTGALRTERAAIRERLIELDEDRDHGRIDRARYLRSNAALNARLVRVEVELEPQVTGSVLDGLAGNPDVASLWFGTLPDRSDGLSVSRRSVAVDKVVRVTVLRSPKGRRAGGGYFSPESVRIEPKG